MAACAHFPPPPRTLFTPLSMAFCCLLCMLGGLHIHCLFLPHLPLLTARHISLSSPSMPQTLQLHLFTPEEEVWTLLGYAVPLSSLCITPICRVWPVAHLSLLFTTPGCTYAAAAGGTRHHAHCLKTNILALPSLVRVLPFCRLPSPAIHCRTGILSHVNP